MQLSAGNAGMEAHLDGGLQIDSRCAALHWEAAPRRRALAGQHPRGGGIRPDCHTVPGRYHLLIGRTSELRKGVGRGRICRRGQTH